MGEGTRVWLLWDLSEWREECNWSLRVCVYQLREATYWW